MLIEKGVWPGDSDWTIRAIRHALLLQLERRISRNTWSICARRRMSSNRRACRVARMRQSESPGYTSFSVMMIHTHQQRGWSNS
ncbi:hypothetical protein Y032_0035g3027 [Ancylostoma ceylanicum]|uniref:Uncharacterized protein n=1 Tax=Ancylostoma ceylanicum TaxID=53326 RepID=A0A016ULV0_9BILA|nr:hypothetical protein Y032_0035g3027 [Ancylostoma ceylanicum]